MSMYLVNIISCDYSLNEKLTGLERTILKEYAAFTNDDGTSGYPSLATLSRRTGNSRRHLIRVVQSLVKKGFLIKVKDFDRNAHRATEYRIEVMMIKQDRILYTFPVDKSVDNPVDKSHTVNLSSDMVSGGGSDMVSHESSLRSMINDHDYKEEDKIKQGELLELLMHLGVYKQKALGWIKNFGYDKIVSELELMSKQKGIINPGGYLGAMLNNNRHHPMGDSKMAEVKRVHMTCEETQDMLKNMHMPKGKKTQEVKEASIHLLRNILKGSIVAPRRSDSHLNEERLPH